MANQIHGSLELACYSPSYYEEMSSHFDSLLEAYRQTTFEFGVADIFTDDSPDVAGRTGSFVLLMNQAKIGKDGD